MMRWLYRFKYSLAVFTRIPVNIKEALPDAEYPRLSVFFPLIGLICGIFAAAGAGIGLFTGSKTISALLALLFGLFITGAYHVDGLADTFDAIGSARSRERMLEIMSDSRLGVMGGCALFFDLSAKLLLYGELMTRYGKRALIVILFAPVMGKLCTCSAAALGKPAKPDGSGRLMIAALGAKDLIICALLTLIPALLAFRPLYALGYVLLSCALGLLIAARFGRLLGGLTGDTLGASNELGELLFLLAAFAFGGIIW